MQEKKSEETMLTIGTPTEVNTGDNDQVRLLVRPSPGTGKPYKKMVDQLSTDYKKAFTFSHCNRVFSLVLNVIKVILLVYFLCDSETYDQAKQYEINFAKFRIVLFLIVIVAQYHNLTFIPHLKSIVDTITAKQEANKPQGENADLEAGNQPNQEDEVPIDGDLYDKIVKCFITHKIKKAFFLMTGIADLAFLLLIAYWHHFSFKGTLTWTNGIAVFVNLNLIPILAFIYFLAAFFTFIFIALVFIFAFGAYQNWKNGPVGATEVQLEKLEVHKYTKDLQGNEECVFCLNDYVEGDNIVKLKCDSRHFFHEDCAKAWFKTNATCPVCRVRITV